MTLRGVQLVGAWLIGVSLTMGAVGCGDGGSGGGAITVGTLADTIGSGDCSLREAISTADGFPVSDSGCRPTSGAHRIVFKSGLTGSVRLNQALPPLRGRLTLEGPDFPDHIVISGESRVRVIDIQAGADVELRNLTFTNGESTDGGSGVRNAGATTIEDCTVTSNHSSIGGAGILNVGGELEIRDSWVVDNSAGGAAGGLFAVGGSVTIEDSTFEANESGDGSGGAVSSSVPLTISGSTFSVNISSGGGGAIDAAGPTSIINSTFFHNTANGSGGALAVQGTTSVIASSFADNMAAPQFAGSALFVASGGALTLRSTLVARAADTLNPLCLASGSRSLRDGGYNIGSDHSCGFAASTGASGQRIGDGVDPRLDPAGLQNNGGPTETVALLDDSPAIAAIPPADCTNADGKPLTIDQRGESRPRQQPCTIGAYEASE
ncbi:MAG: CSLREA domain-containing protein [bacterium]